MMEKRSLLAVLLAGLMVAVSAWAAKVQVQVTTATQYAASSSSSSWSETCPTYSASSSSSSSSSASAPTAISAVCVTWGPCTAGAINGGPPTEQASVQSEMIVYPTGATAVPGAVVTLETFPTNLNPACFLAFNADQTGTMSDPTNTLVWVPGVTPTKPVTIGQPILLGGSSSSSSTSSSSSSSTSASGSSSSSSSSTASSSSSSSAARLFVFYCPAEAGTAGQPYANCKTWACSTSFAQSSLVTPNAATNPLTVWSSVQPTDEVPVCGLGTSGSPSTGAPVTWHTKASTGIP